MYDALVGDFRTYLCQLGHLISRRPLSQSRRTGRTRCRTALRAVFDPLEPRILLSTLPAGHVDTDTGGLSISGAAAYTLSNHQLHTTGACTGVSGPSSSALNASNNTKETVNTPPTVKTPAAASSKIVTGTTVNLSVQGNDTNGQNANTLIYTWSVTSEPHGASSPTFSVNGTDAARNITATFSQAGRYTFMATITDNGGVSTTSSVKVTVDQKFNSIIISGIIKVHGVQFSAVGLDQFGNAMTTQPRFKWSVSGVGSINSSGLYTAPATTGTATVTATSGSVQGSFLVTLTSTDGDGGSGNTSGGGSVLTLS